MKDLWDAIQVGVDAAIEAGREIAKVDWNSIAAGMGDAMGDAAAMLKEGFGELEPLYKIARSEVTEAMNAIVGAAQQGCAACMDLLKLEIFRDVFQAIGLFFSKLFAGITAGATAGVEPHRPGWLRVFGAALAAPCRSGPTSTPMRTRHTLRSPMRHPRLLGAVGSSARSTLTWRAATHFGQPPRDAVREGQAARLALRPRSGGHAGHRHLGARPRFGSRVAPGSAARVLDSVLDLRLVSWILSYF